MSVACYNIKRPVRPVFASPSVRNVLTCTLVVHLCPGPDYLNPCVGVVLLNRQHHTTDHEEIKHILLKCLYSVLEESKSHEADDSLASFPRRGQSLISSLSQTQEEIC